MSPRRALAAAGAMMLLALTAMPAAGQEPQIEVVAEGLDAPRGVTVAADGSIYVAEAGTGGPSAVDTPLGVACFGPTGAVTRIADGVAERVVEGLTSAATGPEVGGISDVAVTDDGGLVSVMNLGADPAVREMLPPEFATAGWLVTASADGTLEPFADVAAFEAANDPDAGMGGEVDSNPFGIATVDDGYLVADAGANALLHVAQDGTVSLVAVIPPTTHEFSTAALAAMGAPPEGEGAPAEEASASAAPVPVDPCAPPAAAPAEEAPASAAPAEEAPAAEAPASGPPADVMVEVPVQTVPTSVTVGPDGAYYVGQLTGFPFPVGGASVWKVVPGEDPVEYATGFTNIMGLGFAPDGTLYVAELVHEGLMKVFAGTGAPVGAVLAVPPGGGAGEIVATGEQFMALGGLDVDADGAVYVSTGTLGPGGTVVKITP